MPRLIGLEPSSLPFKGKTVLFSLFLLLLIMSGPAFSGNSEVRVLPSLAELESLVGAGPEVLAALSELDRDDSLRTRQERVSGPKVFAGLTYGAYDEPVSETEDDRISYQKLSGRAGVSFPILGTWNREKIAALQSEIRVLKGRQKADSLKARNLTALRKAYAVLWVEERRCRLLDDFLSMENEAKSVLRERADKGFLLETDRLDFMAAFDLAREERAASELRSVQAMKTVSLATGQLWSRDGPLKLPLVPYGEGRYRLEESFEEERLPELRHREDLAEFQQEIYETTRDIDLEGNLDVGVTWGTDFPGSTGTGVYVGVTVKEPFGILRAHEDKAREAAAAELDRVRSEALLARLQERGALMESLALHQFGLASLATAETQMAASSEGIRMNRLRHGMLPGDTYEKLLQSRNRYMKDALDLFDAESLILQTEMELLRFAYPDPGQEICDPRVMPLPDEETRSRLLDPSWLVKNDTDQASSRREQAVTAADIGVRAAYVWWADPLLDADRREKELDRFRNSGFSRMLLSFTAGELRFIRTASGRKALTDLLSEGAERGIRMDLLLGDPSWILPAHRTELMDLVSFFESFPFRGIHLDLEPDSLPDSSSRREVLLEEMLRTARAVRLRSSRPLSLSIHPRYLEGALGEKGGIDLEKLELEEIVVMIYSTKADGVTRRFRKIAETWPALRLGLAQSVEKVLPRTVSYSFLGRKAFNHQGERLERVLRGGNFAGLFVQSWKDYWEMNP